MIKHKNKEYPIKVIDIDTQMAIIDKANKEIRDEGQPTGKTMLEVVRAGIDISEDELATMGVANIMTIAGKLMTILTTGKKK